MATFFCPEKQDFLLSQNDYLETARYIGYSKIRLPDDTIIQMIKEACEKLLEVIKPQAVFEEFDLSLEIKDEKPIITFADVNFESKDLARNLQNCEKIYLMACTIGPQVDSIIRREQTLNAAMAAVLQGAGAMFIEKLVDLTNFQIKMDAQKKGRITKHRYSPGYGDVSLSCQKDFFRLLPCTRIGLTLMDTMIMAPEKSVTAYIGSYKNN